MHLLTKGCPRCNGDLSKVNDIGESYYSCVQCGHSIPEAAASRIASLRTAVVPAVPKPFVPRAA